MVDTNGSPDIVFDLRGVRKSFATSVVLHDVNLELHRGETLGIIGPSGSGKTVLLKCMVALLPIDGGELYFEQRSVPGMRDSELLRLRQQVGLVFQAGALFDSLTVGENLLYGLHEQYFRQLTREQMLERVAQALEAVGLPVSEAHTMPRELSGGMQKRVGVARALITRPEVVLYDDPTQGLDPPNAHLISDLIAEVRAKHQVTSVIVSHDLRTIFTLCNRVAVLDEGRIVETGPPEALADSEHSFVRDFIRGHPPEEPFDPLKSQPPEPWPA